MTKFCTPCKFAKTTKVELLKNAFKILTISRKKYIFVFFLQCSWSLNILFKFDNPVVIIIHYANFTDYKLNKILKIQSYLASTKGKF